MFEDTDRAQKAIQMMRDNPRISYFDFIYEFKISMEEAKRLYASIMISNEL